MNGVLKEIAHSSRLYDYEVVCGAAEEKDYPQEYEIPRENTGTLKNQGTIGACVACVISQIAEVLHKMEFDESLEVSEGFIYGTFRKDNHKGEGLYVSQALEYWRTIGTVPKHYFDILKEMPKMKETVKKFPELLDIATKYKIHGYVSINYADRARKDLVIKKALTENSYPLLAVSDEYFRESHCIELVGWNDKTGCYKIKNSWGETYGDHGFAEIPKDEVNAVYMIIPQEIELPFDDVKKEDWFYKYIKNSYCNGTMKGTSATTFEPNRYVTRAELAVVIDNLKKDNDRLVSIINKLVNEKV